MGDTFTVPECEFEEPEGLIFGRWSIGGEDLFPGEVLELTEDTEIHAYWVEPLTINVDVYCGETKGIGGIVSFPADTIGKESNKGTSISETFRKTMDVSTLITAIPGNGYEVDHFEIADTVIEGTANLVGKGKFIYIYVADYISSNVDVKVYFKKTATILDGAELSIDLPVEGNAVRPVTVYTENDAKYSVTESFWLCPDSDLTPEPFKAGVNYRAHIILKPDEEDVVFSKYSNITVNGEKPADIWENEDGRSVTVITKNYKPMELIDTLEIFLNFPAISDVPNVADAWVKEGSPYKIYSAAWFNAVEQNGEEKYSEPASYVSGGSYFIEISLTPEGEYVFADTDKIKATVNGVSARVEAVASNQIAVIPDPYIFGLAGTPYKLTVGNEAEWKPGDGAFEIVVKHESDATNHTFEKFNGVEVDGEKVDPSEYEASAGSVKIKFKESYLARLSTGEHKIVVFFNDGYMAAGTFTTNKADGSSNGENVTDLVDPQGKDVTQQGKDVTQQGKDVTQQGKDVTQQGKDVTPEANDASIQDGNVSPATKNVSLETKNVSPQTGDDTHLVFGFIILMISIFGIVLCIKSKKKKSKE